MNCIDMANDRGVGTFYVTIFTSSNPFKLCLYRLPDVAQPIHSGSFVDQEWQNFIHMESVFLWSLS